MHCLLASAKVANPRYSFKVVVVCKERGTGSGRGRERVPFVDCNIHVSTITGLPACPLSHWSVSSLAEAA